MIPICDEGPNALLTCLDRDGFAFVRHAVSAKHIEEIKKLCAATSGDPSAVRRGDSVYGIRSLLTNIPPLREIVSGPPFIEWAITVLGRTARPVYGVFFDKTPGANWPIAWHQDVTIRVRERRDVPGFEPRPVKDGMVHMLPPIEVSEQIVAFRIHLDDASPTHGALRVIPGSHRLGRLTNEQLQQQHEAGNIVSCQVQTGDVMLMRPLLVHASSPCEFPGRRRVIHIEYAAIELPGGLEWQG